MFVDYFLSMRVGYKFSLEEVIKPFATVIPEVSHLEDRFDPRTGEKVDPEKVVDERERLLLKFNGENIVEDERRLNTLADLIAERVGCRSFRFGNTNFSASLCSKKNSGFVFGPFLDCYEAKQTAPTGFLTLNANLDVQEVLAKTGELETIGAKLRELGLRPSRPQIIQCWEIF